MRADLVQLVRDAVPRLRSEGVQRAEKVRPSARSSYAAVTRARAEDRLEEAIEGCRKLLELDTDDEAASAVSEIESVLVDREVEGLVGMALAYAADGEFALAMGIAEKVERLAPWSPRYLRLQVYLDEEGARRKADTPDRDELGISAPRGAGAGGPSGGGGNAPGHARPRAGPQAHRGACPRRLPPWPPGRPSPQRRRRRRHRADRRLRASRPPAALRRHRPRPAPATAAPAPATAHPPPPASPDPRHHRRTRGLPRPWP